MSFRTSGVVASRSFELVRQSLLQSERLPFTNALTAEHIQQACDDEGVAFGDPDGRGNPAVYTPAIVLWAMLSQALFTGEERSCRAAVLRVALYLVLTGRPGCSTNTGAYCRARAKVTEGVVQRLAQVSPHAVKPKYPSPGGGLIAGSGWSMARRCRCPTLRKTRPSILNPHRRLRGWGFRSCGFSRWCPWPPAW